MATSGLYGSSPSGATVAAPGSESAGLYGNSTTFGGSYFEWFIFIQSDTQPATPTGGSWSFTTNSGTPPTGWSVVPPSAPTLPIWVSIALVNSKNSATLTWSAPGLFAYSSGLPILSGSGEPNPGDGLTNQLYIQTGTTPETIWFKQAGTWTRLTGSTLYADLTSNQTIAGTKTFSSQIQGSISGTASNVTGIVGITNGGTGSTTAAGARTALGVTATGQDTTYAYRANNLSDLASASSARTNLGLGTSAVLNAGVANGVATLDSGGTVPLSQIPASIQGGVSYQGTWNASTNTPTLTSSVGTKGYYYVVSVAGSTNLNGITDWQIGDWAIYSGTAWQKIDNTDAVTSVNGYTGTVVLNAADVGALSNVTSTDGSVTITSPTSTTRDLSVATAASTTNVLCQVRNTTGATLTKGTVVYISGATGQLPTVSKAIATGDSTSAQTLGMMTADLANNSNGYVTVIGLITNIDTSAYTDGAQLYLSGTTAGAVTATKPSAPIHLVYIAVVEYAHPTQGKLFVKVQNGYELDEIHDVSIVSPTTGQTLVYSASTDLWSNSNAPVISGTTINNTTIGATTASSGAFTTLSASSDVTLSGGTANGVLYLNGSKQATSGSALTFDGTNLGVAMPDPASFLGKFGVNGNIALGTGGIQYFWDTANAFGWSIQNISNSLVFGNYGGSERLRLTTTSLYTASGINVGIGTSSPASYGGRLVVESNGVTDGIVVGDLATPANNTSLYLRSTGLSKIYTALGGAITFGANGGNEYGRFDSAGNLGLGVTPSAWGSGYRAEDVGGAFAITSSTTGDAWYNCYNNGTNNIYKNGGYKASLFRQNNGAFEWHNTNTVGTAGNAISFTQAMTLDASGNLGVGTTSPAARLHVVGGDGTVGNEYNSFYVSNASNSSKRVAISYDTTNDTGIIAAVHAGTAWKNLSIPYGQLGVGTPTPESKLAVKGSSGDSDLFSISDIGVPTSGAEYGVAMIKSASTDYLLNITSYSANGKGLRIYHNGGTQSNYAFYVTSASGDRLIVDGLGNLGIGTSSPSQVLEVRGFCSSGGQTGAYALQTLYDNTAGAINVGGGLSFAGNDGINSRVTFATINGSKENATSGNYAGYLSFKTRLNGGSLTEQMRLDSAGNLGLGVTPSAWGNPFKAIEGGDFNNQEYIGFQSNANAIKIGTNHYYDGANYLYKFNGGASRYDVNDTSFIWNLAASGTAGTVASFTQAMTLDASGNLGVGTTSPSRNIVAYGSSLGAIALQNATTGVASGDGFQIQAYLNEAYIWNYENSFLAFGTNATERARIDSSGRLLVGANSTVSASGGALFQVSQANDNWISFAENTSALGSVYVQYLRFSGQAPNDATSMFTYMGDTVGQRMSVKSNGGIYNYSANDSNLSDRREKTNFAPAKSYLDVICSIPVQTFNYIEQNLEEDDGLTLGVVAQDVQAVAPELVTETNWGTREEPKMRLSIYQTDLQYALMKCIQEQQAIIESLKARLDAANL